MTGNHQNYLSIGIYTVPDAARLSGVSTWRIRRWLRGYTFRTRKKEHYSPALWRGQLQPIDGSLALGFLDLIEVRFVDAFLKAGVSWAILRKAHEQGVKIFKDPHPFCKNRFFTDGREIFVKLLEDSGRSSLLEIVRNQHVFAQITTPFLKELEFAAGDVLLRWRPETSRRAVVLDPTRSFGRPIIDSRGIPTEVLSSAAKACGSVKEVARWYDVPEPEIEEAMEFEQKLAA
jgi:uncharacterized protein (DUF433 family)